MASWVNRMVGAAMLRSDTYEEVEADRSANGQALGVVLIAAVAAGLGQAQSGTAAVAIVIIGALVGWVIWSAMTWFIGTKILKTPETVADIGELLRTTGFASAPGVIRIFHAVPIVGGIFNFVASLWMLAAMVIAVRQALDYRSTGRALAVCAIGWLINVAIITWGLVLVGLGSGFLNATP
jgi:hypothetical protein